MIISFNPTFLRPYTSTYILNANKKIYQGEFFMISESPVFILSHLTAIKIAAPSKPINSIGIPIGDSAKKLALVATTIIQHTLNIFQSIST